MSQKPVKLGSVQRSGRPAADIDGVQLSARVCPSQKVQLLKKSVQIILHPLFPELDGGGGEGTVQTDAGAERDSHIEAPAVLIVQTLQHLPLPVGDGDGQGRLFLAAVVGLPHITGDFQIGTPGLQHSHGDLHRADARQRSPGQLLSRIRAELLVQEPFHLVLERLPFRIFHPGAALLAGPSVLQNREADLLLIHERLHLKRRIPGKFLLCPDLYLHAGIKGLNQRMDVVGKALVIYLYFYHSVSLSLNKDCSGAPPPP